MLRRRDFLRLGAAGLFVAGAAADRLWAQLAFAPISSPSSEKTLLAEQLWNDEFPFPYDEQMFESAERVANVRRVGESGWRADLNLILKPGKTLDLKVLVSDRIESLPQTNNVQELTGVKDMVNLVLEGAEAKRAYYQVLYREGKDNWQALSPKSFKLPFINLEKGEAVKVILIGDEHTFDDADYEVPESLKASKLNGDYVNEFLKNLRKNPNWTPAKPLSALKNGFYLALAIRYLMANEDPDLVLLLGDTTGIGANYRWAKFGLPVTNLKSSDYNSIAQIFWLRMRKLYSALSPSVPIFIVLGNHDGEEQWNAAAAYATYWRKKYFALPEQSTYAEGGHPEGKYYSFSWGADKNNRGGILFVVLNTTAFTGPSYPAKLEQWSLGEEQRLWLEKTLNQAEKDWIFLCSHHVLGGWPAGPEETQRDIVYGRGPLFVPEDYKDYADPEKIEQVWITKKALENGARAFVYGHDHIFASRRIGYGMNNLDLTALCVGSTKYVGEKSWWGGALWKKHYGQFNRVPPDFWGPSGITRATILNKEVRFDYILTGWTVHSNLPESLVKGTVLRSVILSSPPAQLACEPDALSFRGVEGGSNPEDKTLRLKNAGSGRLQFSLISNVSWLKLSPAEGESWGKEQIIKAGVTLGTMEEGRYEGTVAVASAQAKNSPVLVKVELIVDPPPIYPPLNLIGIRKQKPVLGVKKTMVLLSWQANPLNRKIIGYRIYIYGQKGQRTLLGEVAATKRSFLVENIALPLPWIFAVAAVDYKEREGQRAEIIIR